MSRSAIYPGAVKAMHRGRKTQIDDMAGNAGLGWKTVQMAKVEWGAKPATLQVTHYFLTMKGDENGYGFDWFWAFL